MGKLKTALFGGSLFLLAFAWKLLILILVCIFLFYGSRRLINYLYQKSHTEKWE